MEQFGIGAVMAGYVSIVIEWLKSQKWFPFAQFNAFYMNVAMAAVSALVSAGAISYTFSETGDFSLAGNIYAVRHTMFLFMQQYLFQHFFYKTISAPPPTPILTKAAEAERNAEAKGQ